MMHEPVEIGIAQRALSGEVETGDRCLVKISGNSAMIAVVDGLAPALAPGTFLYESVSIAPRYDPFVRGEIELPAVLYFVLQGALYQWINAMLLGSRRA